MIPVFALLSANIVEITFAQALRSLLWSLGCTAALLLLWLALARSWARAGLATSYIVFLFYNFKSGYNLWRSWLPEGSPFAQANVMAALWAVTLIIGAWSILRRLRPLAVPTLFANIIGLAALAGTLYPLGVYYGRALVEGPFDMLSPEDLSAEVSIQPESRPDIYYIILDGYGRADALREIYQLDNSPFLSFLTQRGFTIASRSTTNYSRTMHSLSSSLNYHYLDQLFIPRPESNNYDAFRILMKDNAVQRFLKAQGYHTVALATGFEITEVSNADTFIQTGHSLSYFEEILLSRTLAVFYVDQKIGDIRRAGIHQAFTNLKAAVDIPGPKFVFAHLVVPHPPFVFDEHGGPIAPRGYGDGTSYAGGREHYLQSYGRQLLYVNQQVEELVNHLQKNSATPPVIILQGDHGPGAYVDWIDWRNTCYRERMPILNAYSLPGIPTDAIPQDITPVNTFRLVFNHYFGTQFALESNHHYTVLLPQPYRYIDVTEQLESCPVLPE